MNDEKKAIDELRDILASFVEKSFPKKCACGKTYLDLDHFLSDTTEGNYPSDLLQLMGYHDHALTALARDCNCGSPLVVIINDRRDRTIEGMRVRRDFGKLVNILEATGVDPVTARRELLNVLEGREARLLVGRELEMVKKLKPSWERVTGRGTPDAADAISSPPPVREFPVPAAKAAATPEAPAEDGAGQKQCEATTKAGKQCKLIALPGSDFCQLHQPKD